MVSGGLLLLYAGEIEGVDWGGSYESTCDHESRDCEE